jgi:hypothetical protein
VSTLDAKVEERAKVRADLLAARAKMGEISARREDLNRGYAEAMLGLEREFEQAATAMQRNAKRFAEVTEEVGKLMRSDVAGILGKAAADDQEAIAAPA